jgi:tetratricopeptide (TPR) repeat protein
MSKRFSKKRIWPILVSLGSTSVMILAFFIPSIQDQWDRYQSRKVIQQYEELGNDLFNEDRYEMAEKAYEKAFELSEEKRLDIEVKRLNAHVNRINSKEEWGSKPPEDLEDVDFQFLLHLQKGNENIAQRVSTLNSYSVYLSGLGRTSEARKVLDEALILDLNNPLLYVNLGNLMDQQGKKEDAETAYLKAIQLDSTNVQAHYNLGLVYAETNKLQDARNEFRKALTYEPTDTLIQKEYNSIVGQINN